MAQAAVAITDDLGRQIVLERPATRVIALYGAFNEILAALGRENTLVARTNADELPVSLLSKPSIGTHLRPNPELIVGLKPELVLQISGRDEALEPVRMLEGHGVKTAVFRMDNFEDLFATIERLGVLTDSVQEAQSLVARYRTKLASLRTSWPTKQPRILFEVRYPNLLAAGTASITSEIIAAAGGENAVTAPEKLVRLNEEEVLRLHPDMYLIQTGPMNPAPQPLTGREHFRTLDCLRTGQVFTVDQQLFSRPGPRSIEAAEQLHALILKHAQGGGQ